MTHPALRSRLGGADHEERLARAAAGGNARAFATLYGRYEERVFGLAFRLTGSAGTAAQATRDAFADALDAMSHVEGAAARFGSCLLIAVRNHSLELMAGCPEDGDGDEPADAFEAAQVGTRHAVLSLDGSFREVLALGSLKGLRPGGIATIMDLDAAVVPELSAAARLGLHDELWGPDADLPPPSEECSEALPLMALRDDAQIDEEDRAWLVEHLAHCGACRLRLDAMEQAQAAYDRWEVPAPPESLFTEASAAAGRFTEEDGKRGRRSALTPAVATAGAAAASTLATAGGAAASTLSSARAGASRLGSSAWGRRPWSDRLVTAGLVLVIILGLSATLAGATLVIRGSDRSEPATPAGENAGTPTRRAPRVVVPPKSEAVAKPRKRKKARASSQRAKVVVVKPVAPKATPKREVKAEPQGEVPTAEAVPLPKTTPTTPEPAPNPPPARTTPEPPQPQPAPGTPAPPPAQ